MGGIDPEDAEIYEKHAESLTRLATLMVGPDDAADVVSVAVVRTLGSSGWRQARNRPAYLTRVVQNEARRWQRSSARRRDRESRVARHESIDGPVVEPEILAAVRGLSSRQQAVVLLTYWDDLAPREVGDRLGISEGAVRRHLARARARLRRALDA